MREKTEPRNQGTKEPRNQGATSKRNKNAKGSPTEMKGRAKGLPFLPFLRTTSKCRSAPWLPWRGRGPSRGGAEGGGGGGGSLGSAGDASGSDEAPPKDGSATAATGTTGTFFVDIIKSRNVIIKNYNLN